MRTHRQRQLFQQHSHRAGGRLTHSMNQSVGNPPARCIWCKDQPCRTTPRRWRREMTEGQRSLVYDFCVCLKCTRVIHRVQSLGGLSVDILRSSTGAARVDAAAGIAATGTAAPAAAPSAGTACSATRSSASSGGGIICSER